MVAAPAGATLQLNSASGSSASSASKAVALNWRVAPSRRSALVGSISTRSTLGLTTVTVEVAVIFSLKVETTVMTASPSATPVTTPSATVATLESEIVQVKPSPSIVSPFLSRAVAVSVTVRPGATDAVLGLSVTLKICGGTTVSLSPASSSISSMTSSMTSSVLESSSIASRSTSPGTQSPSEEHTSPGKQSCSVSHFSSLNSAEQPLNTSPNNKLAHQSVAVFLLRFHAFMSSTPN